MICICQPSITSRRQTKLLKEFLTISKERGNDLVTPRPEFEFPGLAPGDRWCLCLGRWVEALEATRRRSLPETTVPPVVLDATNESVLDRVDLETLEAHAYGRL